MTDTSAATPTPAGPTATPSLGRRLELTLRALVLGCLLAVVFTAANTYLGLLVGLTFASAIPAAVISMAALRIFKSSTIWENMTVQTVASVGGSMSAIIFVLPALVMVGWWTSFPFWQSVAICILGGVLGVTFSIPLRRSLVVKAGLPYPEGVAAAAVLKVGSRGAAQTESAVRENKKGLGIVVIGAVVSAAYALGSGARVFAGEAATFFRLPAALGGGATGLGFGMQFALLGAGHLIGLAVGLSQLVGLIIAWGLAVPIMTAIQATPGAAEEAAVGVWAEQVRFMGAGVIGVAAIWTLLKMAGPLIGGLTSALAANARRASGETLERTEQDIPINLPGLSGRDRRAAGGVRPGHGPGRIDGAACRGRADLCRRHRLHGRGHLRLHGRPARLLEQPGVGRRHPGHHHRVAFDAGGHVDRGRARRPLDHRLRPDGHRRGLSPSSPTTIYRTSRPASWSRPRRGASRPP